MQTPNFSSGRKPSTWSDLFAALFVLGIAGCGFVMMGWMAFGPRSETVHENRLTDTDRARQRTIERAAETDAAWQKQLDERIAAEKRKREAAMRPNYTEPGIRPSDIRP